MAKIKEIARWIVLAPAAIVAAMLAPALAKFLLWLSMFESDTVLWRLTVELGGGGAMGVAFVYVAAMTAPRRQYETALVAAAIGLAIAGAGVLANLAIHRPWDIVQAAACGFGAAAIGWAVIKGELFPRHREPHNVPRET